MVRALEIPKTPPQQVARATLDGVERGEDDIFPDPMLAPVAERWQTSPVKDMERQNAALVAADPIAA
jgi:hypothetical protein